MSNFAFSLPLLRSPVLFGALLGGAILFCPLVTQAGTLTVTSSQDAGGTCPGSDCTLRQAIATAAPGDTIDFANTITTVTLTSGSLLINKNLTIDGYEAFPVTVQRGEFGVNFRVFSISSGDLDVTLSGLVIRNGRLEPELFGALAGSGIYNGSSGILTVTGCTISYNSAFLSGGGILNTSGGTVIISNSTIAGNGSDANGGGIYNLGHVTIANSTIGPGNYADDAGGGIQNLGSLFVTNSTISGNEVYHSFSSGTAQGGGIYNGSAGTMALLNTTVSDNDCDNSFNPADGGGIYNASGGTVSARNTIIAGNTVSGAGAPDFKGELTSQGFNLIGNNLGATITPAQITDQIGASDFPINPRLGPLQDNGGLRQTQAPFPDSTAIDKGHSSGSSSDQRGFARPMDDPAIPNVASGDGGDIGAVEVQPPTPTPAKSLNISTRSRVHAVEGRGMIAGFIITGNAPKSVVVRFLGPSLKGIGLTGVLPDPMLRLYGPDFFETSNDNWRDDPDQALLIEATGIPPQDDLESALVATLPAGNYTAVCSGNPEGAGEGLAVVEVYDLEPGGASILANISTRAFVDTGNDVVIGGFILGSEAGSPRMVIRAIGPSLAGFDVPDPLADPTLELRDGNGALIAFNDNWRDDQAQAAQLILAFLAPRDELEAAIVATLPPGAYTTIVAGTNGGTGVGLVEVYNLQ